MPAAFLSPAILQNAFFESDCFQVIVDRIRDEQSFVLEWAKILNQMTSVHELSTGFSALIFLLVVKLYTGSHKSSPHFDTCE
jgi:hypothetical protein